MTNDAAPFIIQKTNEISETMDAIAMRYCDMEAELTRLRGALATSRALTDEYRQLTNSQTFLIEECKQHIVKLQTINAEMHARLALFRAKG